MKLLSEMFVNSEKWKLIEKVASFDPGTSYAVRDREV
jgi:hypothetical protein